MTIRAGEEWGHRVERPADLQVFASDADLAAAVVADPAGNSAVSGGDLHRSLGSPALGERAELQRVTIDLLRIDADGRRLAAVAHLVMRRSLWRGRTVAAMNVDHLGAWCVAPRAHPNDGRLDIVDAGADLSWRDRLKARSRLPQGTHVPHPAIDVSSRTSMSWAFDEPVGLWLDAVRQGSARRVAVRVEPDAFALHI